MTAIERTAYPRPGVELGADQLQEAYTLSDEEKVFVEQHARGDRGRLVLALLLKSRIALGYFPPPEALPQTTVSHIGDQLDVSAELQEEDNYRTSLHRYRNACRKRLKSAPFSEENHQLVVQQIHEAAKTMSDPADLINVAIETLIKEGVELPAFSTLDRLIGRERKAVHRRMYAQISGRLTKYHQERLDEMLVVQPEHSMTLFASLKQAPGPATLPHFRKWSERLIEVDLILDPLSFLDGIAYTKLRQFAAEARAYEISDMRAIAEDSKKHTLLLCFLWSVQSKTRDELVDMFLRRMRRVHHSAKTKLQELQQKHRELEESLIGVLREVVKQAAESDSHDALGSKVAGIFSQHGGAESLDEKLTRVSAYHDNNYFPLMWAVHVPNRAVVFRVLDQVEIKSATQDSRLIQALGFIKLHRSSRKQILPTSIDIGFMPSRWRSFILNNEQGEVQFNRQALELGVLTHLAESLQAGDLYIENSEAYSDYRQQLLPWEVCEERLPDYCEAVKIKFSGNSFIEDLKSQLKNLSSKIDSQFPKNSEFSIDADGVPHLRRLPLFSTRPEDRAFKEEVYSRVPERHLLDILKSAQHWTRCFQHFRPPSGSDTKIADAETRYLYTVFGFGCNLGASQTARHAPSDIHRQTLRRINAQHVSAEKLEAASGNILNEYARFDLPKHWGSAKVAIADGTHIPLRKNNLIGEQHIRYGGYGGIAYHHISGEYIALFSNFIACGVWEAVYILDALLLNKSVYQPDTLHADTHGQSEPVFALAHLLGIKLFPRMRNWNDVVFYRADSRARYQHIDALFARTVNWSLIETHWKDMMQVVISIQAGKVQPSMLLRKLNSHNRKNRLYLSFRELGRVIRTLFLLRYVSEGEFRQSIRAETTKVESYNDFCDWITFGGELIKSGDPVEQSKQIKYTNLIANAIMLQNVADLTTALNEMAADGISVSKPLVASLSPYIREHIRRFGRYDVNMSELPPDLDPKPVRMTA